VKSSKSDKNNLKTSKISTKQLSIILGTLVIILIILFWQQQTKPVQPALPIEPETPVQEPEQQTCTAIWLCQDENTKAFRNSDCTFYPIVNCPAGCENAECNEVIGEPKLEEPIEEAKKGCELGWACLDKKRKGYQLSNCMFNNVKECKYGCRDGECLKTVPPEEKEEEQFSLTQGKLMMNKTGWRYTDFSKGELFQEDINDYDFKIKIYPNSLSYNYFRTESYRSDLWIIEKGITEAVRSDCMDKTIGSNKYYNLKTAQTLCIQTKEKGMALVGAYWEKYPEEDTKITWKYYLPK